ncbi:hypothetical protein ACFXAO_03815 [Streptomyces lavendulae]|uniref:hypothetical protein n=1 Tax=Streptomyces lavendulae TaxID=1914 RepID=UPI0036809769
MLIQEMARTARALAAQAGQAVSEPVLHEVEQILHAVFADPDVAALWAAGQLVKAPDAARGFTGLEPAPGAAPLRRAARPDAPAKEHARPPEPDAGGRVVQARRERAGAARAEAAEAAAEAERLETARAAVREVADRAGRDLAAAEEEVRAAGERLEEARADAVARLKEAGRAAAKMRGAGRDGGPEGREAHRARGMRPPIRCCPRAAAVNCQDALCDAVAFRVAVATGEMASHAPDGGR